MIKVLHFSTLKGLTRQHHTFRSERMHGYDQGESYMGCKLLPILYCHLIKSGGHGYLI